MDRIAMLQEILSQNPDDAFARYGLALEHSKQGDVNQAMEEFGIDPSFGCTNTAPPAQQFPSA